MSTDRLSLYREAMDLESERAKIQAELARVSSRLTAIHGLLASGAQPERLPKSVEGAVGVAASRRKGRARRGELREEILQALQAAGKNGLRVQALAAELGAKPINIYSWFQYTAAKIPQIRKIGRGVYRWEGPALQKSAEVKSPKARKARGAGRHGALKAQVETLLKAAGAKGLTVRELAERIGVKHTNLSVWFSTTGKKNKAIKKIAPGHFKHS